MKLSKARLKGIEAAITKRSDRAFAHNEGIGLEKLNAYLVVMIQSTETIGHALLAKQALWEERRILYGYGDGKAPRKTIRA